MLLLIESTLMKTYPRTLLKSLAQYSPVIIGCILMIPRLLSPQFGFFDDATTLTTSENILNGTWSLADEAYHGRFRPIYWLYYAIIYAFTGQNPLWFFMGNTLLLSLITIGLIHLARALGFSRLQAWFAGIAFILAGSTLENAYTLSKPELQQGLWLILSLLSIGLYTQANSNWKKSLSLALSVSTIFLACASKETSLVILPISFAWFLISWFLNHLHQLPDKTSLPARRAYLIASFIGVIAFLALRSLNLPTGLIESGYPNNFDFSRAHMFANARIWMDLLLRDYFYLIPLALLPLLLWLKRRDIRWLYALIDTGTWMLAWIVIYIPWVYTQEYYLLPFAAGAAIFGAVLLKGNLTVLRSAKVPWRVLSALLLVLAAIFFSATLPTNLTKVRAQLAVDASNDEMLHYVLANAPQNGVVLINIQEPNEYVGHFKTLVNIVGQRPDLQVDYFKFQDPLQEGWEENNIMIVSPIVENQFYPSMRMGVFEMPSRTWNQSLLEYMGDQAELISQARHHFRSAIVDTPRLICFIIPSLDYCKVPHSPLDNRVFAYGWDIYSYKPPVEG
jgi:hypothetical protein